MVSWGHLGQRGGGCITLDPVHPTRSPSPAFYPCSPLSPPLEEGDPLPSKGRSSWTQSLVIRLL